jgi:hypothetical protein
MFEVVTNFLEYLKCHTAKRCVKDTGGNLCCTSLRPAHATTTNLILLQIIIHTPYITILLYRLERKDIHSVHKISDKTDKGNLISELISRKSVPSVCLSEISFPIFQPTQFFVSCKYTDIYFTYEANISLCNKRNLQE